MQYGKKVRLFKQAQYESKKASKLCQPNSSGQIEASSLDQIKMTEFWLYFDRKIFTPTNVNVRT